MAEHSPKHRLTRHCRGWVKYAGGKVRWICSLNEAPTGDAADLVFEEKFAELMAPARPRGEVTIEDVFNVAIAAKREANRSARLIGDYKDAGYRLGEVLGDTTSADSLGPPDWSRVGRAWTGHSPSRRAKLVIVTKSAFRLAADAGLIRPPSFGGHFRTPTRAEHRRHRAARGKLMYTPPQIRALLAKADSQMRVAVLLGINCAYGNEDCASLTWGDVDPRGWIEVPRGKTGIDRRCPLWPETVKALRKLRAARKPRPEDNVLLGERGAPLISDAGTSHNDRLAVAFTALCEAAGVPNMGFYSLRRTWRTIADEALDQRAAALIFGHETGDVASIYVQAITDQRLTAVSTYVHDRVFGASRPAPGGSSSAGDAAAG